MTVAELAAAWNQRAPCVKVSTSSAIKFERCTNVGLQHSSSTDQPVSLIPTSPSSLIWSAAPFVSPPMIFFQSEKGRLESMPGTANISVHHISDDQNIMRTGWPVRERAGKHGEARRPGVHPRSHCLPASSHRRRSRLRRRAARGTTSRCRAPPRGTARCSPPPRTPAAP